MSEIKTNINGGYTFPVIVETSSWVMDCPNVKLVETCRDFLEIIDDLQQVCPPQHSDELSNYFNRIEVYTRSIAHEDNLPVKFRNELRSTFKYIMQLCSIYDYQPSKALFV